MPLQSAVMEQFIICESCVFLIKQIKCKSMFAMFTCKKKKKQPICCGLRNISMGCLHKLSGAFMF